MCFIWNIRKASLQKGAQLFTPESRATPIGQRDGKANWGYILGNKIGLVVQAYNLTTKETEARKNHKLNDMEGSRLGFKTAWASQ